MKIALGLALGLVAGCGGLSGEDGTNSDSEVAASVVSGALNNSGGGTVSYELPHSRKTILERLADDLNPIGTAFAAMWNCSGGTLAPSWDGAGSYQLTPVSCSVSWGNGKTASAAWSSTFDLDYGASCDKLRSPWIGDQAAGCAVTRTTAAGGNTRTITGPDGNVYAIDHDTNGANSGWDSSVTPAPSNGGVIATCAAGGCKTGGGTLVISGSHVTGTVTLGGKQKKIWDHTLSTDASGLQLTGSGVGRVLNGTVNVQHNLLKYTATATFSAAGYGEAGCCFPTTGSVSTTFESGPNKSKTESIAFSAVCGEATLTDTNGVPHQITLQHCL